MKDFRYLNTMISLLTFEFKDVILQKGCKLQKIYPGII